MPPSQAWQDPFGVTDLHQQKSWYSFPSHQRQNCYHWTWEGGSCRGFLWVRKHFFPYLGVSLHMVRLFGPTWILNLVAQAHMDLLCRTGSRKGALIQQPLLPLNPPPSWNQSGLSQSPPSRTENKVSDVIFISITSIWKWHKSNFLWVRDASTWLLQLWTGLKVTARHSGALKNLALCPSSRNTPGQGIK